MEPPSGLFINSIEKPDRGCTSLLNNLNNFTPITNPNTPLGYKPPPPPQVVKNPTPTVNIIHVPPQTLTKPLEVSRTSPIDGRVQSRDSSVFNGRAAFQKSPTSEAGQSSNVVEAEETDRTEEYTYLIQNPDGTLTNQTTTVRTKVVKSPADSNPPTATTSGGNSLGPGNGILANRNSVLSVAPYGGTSSVAAPFGMGSQADDASPPGVIRLSRSATVTALDGQKFVVMPQAPTSLTQNLPTPEAIERQKEQYMLILEQQIQSAEKSLQEQVKYQAEFLKEQALQKKKRFNAGVDAQLQQEELLLQQQFQEELVQLKTDMAEQKLVFEQKAMFLAMEWEQKRAENSLIAKQVQMQRAQNLEQQRLQTQMMHLSGRPANPPGNAPTAVLPGTNSVQAPPQFQVPQRMSSGVSNFGENFANRYEALQFGSPVKFSSPIEFSPPQIMDTATTNSVVGRNPQKLSCMSQGYGIPQPSGNPQTAYTTNPANWNTASSHYSSIQPPQLQNRSPERSSIQPSQGQPNYSSQNTSAAQRAVARQNAAQQNNRLGQSNYASAQPTVAYPSTQTPTRCQPVTNQASSQPAGPAMISAPSLQTPTKPADPPAHHGHASQQPAATQPDFPSSAEPARTGISYTLQPASIQPRTEIPYTLRPLQDTPPLPNNPPGGDDRTVAILQGGQPTLVTQATASPGQSSLAGQPTIRPSAVNRFPAQPPPIQRENTEPNGASEMEKETHSTGMVDTLTATNPKGA